MYILSVASKDRFLQTLSNEDTPSSPLKMKHKEMVFLEKGHI